MTDVATGEAEFISVDRDNLVDVLKASTALPLFYRGFPKVNGQPMIDGGVADSIPVQQAIHLGARRVMVVRSRSRSYRKRDSWVHRYIRWRLRRHKALVATMRERVQRHADVVEFLRQPPSDVIVVDVCPPEHFVLGRFARDRDRFDCAAIFCETFWDVQVFLKSCKLWRHSYASGGPSSPCVRPGSPLTRRATTPSMA